MTTLPEPPGWADEWSPARRILAVRLDALGDVLMTGPALRAMRESAPARRITLLTSPSGAEAAALLPEVDEVLVYSAPWMKATPPRASSERDLEMVARIREARFDAAVIFTVYSQNPLPPALLCYLADVPLRLAHCRENPYQLLTHRLAEPEPEQFVRHEVRRQLDLVASVGCRAGDERIRVEPGSAAFHQASTQLDALGLDRSRPWVVIHPGSTASSRRYPPESFAEAARRLRVEHGITAVFTGGPAEDDLVESIRVAMGVPSHSLAGRLDLPGLAALIALAPALISNNTGPVHLAAGVGTPVVDLYALTNPQHTPWGVAHRVLNRDVPCKYCYKSICPEGHHACLRGVEPAEVVAAALELLNARGEPGLLAAG